MHTVRFVPIPLYAAEEFLAELWCRLEEYDIETPSIQAETGSDGMVSLRLTFDSPEAAAVAIGWSERPPDRAPSGAAGTRRSRPLREH
jgi:hypothetical protein